MFGRATITLGIGPHSRFLPLRGFVSLTFDFCCFAACDKTQKFVNGRCCYDRYTEWANITGNYHPKVLVVCTL